MGHAAHARVRRAADVPSVGDVVDLKRWREQRQAERAFDALLGAIAATPSGAPQRVVERRPPRPRLTVVATVIPFPDPNR
jgi:hypothetical protein